MQHLPDAAAAGPAVSARRDLGRARHQLRGVLGACRSGSTFACSSRPGATRSRATRCRNTPTRSGTAICPMRRPACSTAIAPTDHTSRSEGHRFNHHKLLLDPYARAAGRRRALVRRALRLSSAFAARRPVVRPARQRAGDAERRGDRRLVQLGRRSSARRSVVGHRDLRGACARADHAARATSAHPSAAPSRRWRIPR